MPELARKALDLPLSLHARPDLPAELGGGSLLAEVLLQALPPDTLPVAIPVAGLVLGETALQLVGPLALVGQIARQGGQFFLGSFERLLQLRRPRPVRLVAELPQVRGSGPLRREFPLLALEGDLHAGQARIQVATHLVGALQSVALRCHAGPQRGGLLLVPVALLARSELRREFGLHLGLQRCDPLLQLIGPAALRSQVRLSLLFFGRAAGRTVLELAPPQLLAPKRLLQNFDVLVQALLDLLSASLFLAKPLVRRLPVPLLFGQPLLERLRRLLLPPRLS
mmetsp:Transcript_123643/g.357665  ORF Transcript_123643/g.357665 Transcript_123643/m.357665 type:complete len:282 (-) Transcript_123643:924-1769(-)